AGDLVPLEEQDRTRWDHVAITEGVALLDAAARRESPGPYQVQAAIARCHVTAPTASDTDWERIVGLYDELWARMATPVVALNRSIAVAMADGPDVGLALVDDRIAPGGLSGNPVPSARPADRWRLAGPSPE